MKQLNLIFLIGLLALIPSAGKSQNAVEQAMHIFLGQEDKVQISSTESVIEDTLSGKRPMSYFCYTFTMKKKALDDLVQLTAVFKREASNAYTSFTKIAGRTATQTLTVDLDGAHNNIEFGVIRDHNYNVLLFHDKQRPDYRYAYALVYWEESRCIKGQLYKIYSIDPKKRKSGKLDNASIEYLNGLSKLYRWSYIPNRVNRYDSIYISNRAVASKLKEKMTKADENTVELRDSLTKMGERLGELERKLDQLAKDPVKNSKKINEVATEMSLLGGVMSKVSTQVVSEYSKNYQGVYNGDDNCTNMIKQFGSYYALYQECLKQPRDDLFMSSIADNLYKLCSNKEALKDHPEVVEAWKESLKDLQLLETNKYRKRILGLAIQSLMK